MEAQAQKYALAFLRLFGVKGGCGTRIYIPDKALKGSDRIKNRVSQLDGPLSSGSETYGNLAPVDDSHIKYVQSYEFDCSTGGINPLLGLTTFGIIIAATYILFTQVTGRRRRRDLGFNAISSFESQGKESTSFDMKQLVIYVLAERKKFHFPSPPNGAVRASPKPDAARQDSEPDDAFSLGEIYR